MDTSNIKYFMYTRKSRDEDDRQIRSLDDQAADLAEIIEKRGLKVVDKLKESQSAKVKGRPVFNDMLRRIEAGEASGIIAWHPDRLARNAFDGGYIIDLIDGKKIVDLQFYDFWFQNNSQGKAMLADAFTRSKYYSDNLSDVIGRAMRRKRAEGIWPGFSPIGYLNDPITKGIIVDSVRGPLVRKAFEIYAAEACTLDELTARVNALGLTCRPTKKHPSAPLSRSQYHRILTNPIYIGILEHGGEVRPGAHEPLIEKSLFDRVQEIVSGKRKPRLKRPVKSYLYRRTFACGECDCCITNETQKGHVYLRCTKKRGSCSQPFVREDYVSQKIDAALAKLIVPRDWIDFMQSELETELQQQHDSTHDHRKTLLQKLAVCDQKQKRLVEAYAEGILKLEEFGQAKETIDYERLTLKEQ